MPATVHIRHRTRLPVAERRAQIIDAATAIIAERGYWGLSMQDVADSCGLTVNGVLHHVGSKDGLLVAVLEHRDQADVHALTAILGVDHPDKDWTSADLTRTAQVNGIGLMRMCEALVARNADQPEIVRLYSVLGGEALAPDHPAYDYFSARQRKTLDGLVALAPSDVDGPTLAQHLLALMDGLQLQWLRDPSIDLIRAWHTAVGEISGLF